MLTDQTADVVRGIYGALAFVNAMGFVATLIVRWDLLKRGERILRIFLTGFFLVVVYGAYVAIDQNFPPTAVGSLATITLSGVAFGFLVWIWDDLIHGDRQVIRRTDR